jgi:hypothetical protein
MVESARTHEAAEFEIEIEAYNRSRLRAAQRKKGD